MCADHCHPGPEAKSLWSQILLSVTLTHKEACVQTIGILALSVALNSLVSDLAG